MIEQTQPLDQTARAKLMADFAEKSEAFIKTGTPSLKPLIPAIIWLRGKPCSLVDHFPFDPFFNTVMPRRTVLKTGRQVSKSTSLAIQGIIQSKHVPHFSTLFLTPLYEQIRRFSQNYVGKMIEQSPVKRLLLKDASANSVLQKVFANYSQMIFSFAFLDAERTRGISADKFGIDEVQGFDISFLPVVRETISASREWEIEQYSGTPLSLANTLEFLWQESSMAEWVIKCHHAGCGKWNIPALEYDLDKMIGEWRPDISEENPGIVCASCQKPLRPRPVSQGGFGRWEHRFSQRRAAFSGYHIPQIIMPMHYSSAEKWRTLLGKRKRLVTFYNEVCGESYDHGSRMVTLSDLKKAACLPWPCKKEEAIKHIDDYAYRIVSIDWGGGGTRQGKSDLNLQSYTTYAVMGLRHNGKVDVIYGYRSLEPHDHVGEAEMALKLMVDFRCSHIAHDYTGAGTVRETVMRQVGVNEARILSVMYVGPTKFALVNFKPANIRHPKDHFTLDRSRGLNYLCQFIKSGVIRFFQYDYNGEDDPGLLHDFMRLIEDKKDSGSGKYSYKILRDPGGPDDFAHSVHIGTFMLYTMQGTMPNLAEYEDLDISDEELAYLSLPPLPGLR